MNTAHSAKARPEVVVFYPGERLTQQLAAWQKRHPGCVVELSLAKTPAGIRNALRHAALALLDATAGPEEIAEAFTQAVIHLGAYRVTVYSEIMHEGLELPVRVRGALLLLGPLSGAEWDGLFEHLLQSNGRTERGGRAVHRTHAAPAESALLGTRAHELGNEHPLASAGQRQE